MRMMRDGKEHEYKKGLWTVEEDKTLIDYVRIHGQGHWNRIAKKTGLKRCGKSCRLRWMNYLSPNVNRGNFTDQEEDLIIRLHKLLGNRWSLIAKRVPGRTDNQVKNYWNTHLSKKLGLGDHSSTTKPACNTESPPSLALTTTNISSHQDISGEKVSNYEAPSFGGRAVPRSLSACHAEFEAVLWAMECLISLGIAEVELGTDCSDVVQMISYPEEWPAFASYIEDLVRLKSLFSSFSINVIPRCLNQCADSLARSFRG